MVVVGPFCSSGGANTQYITASKPGLYCSAFVFKLFYGFEGRHGLLLKIWTGSTGLEKPFLDASGPVFPGFWIRC